jgi:hypothetical protein
MKSIRRHETRIAYVPIGYLRSVGITAGIGHRDDTRSSVMEIEVLVLKLLAVNRSTTSTIATGKIALIIKCTQ